MSGLYEILRKVQTRPGMYIGNVSISDLFVFLAGYKTARLELGIEPSPEELEFYREFQPWLQNRFQVQTVNSWANIIRLYSQDEKEAFNYFFKLLDEFLSREKALNFEASAMEVPAPRPGKQYPSVKG